MTTNQPRRGNRNTDTSVSTSTLDSDPAGISYRDADGFCTAKPTEEKDCKYILAGHCNGGSCLNRSIVENHCCSFEAYKERTENELSGVFEE